MRYRITLPRESTIPKGATKVSHKASDAVVYLYQSERGRLAAIAFHGNRAAKPDWRFSFRSEAEREAHIRHFFERRAEVLARKVEARAARSAPHRLQLGHVLVASWGYDQTNINFYQVTRLVGRNSVELRELHQLIEQGEAWATGKAMPRIDDFKGEPFLRRVDAATRSIRVSKCQWARLWDGSPESWTAYA